MKRLLPLTIAIVAGFLILIAYFIPALSEVSVTVQDWFKILAVGAMVLGGGNLIKLHLMKVSGQRKEWGYSVVTICVSLVSSSLGFSKWVRRRM